MNNVIANQTRTRRAGRYSNADGLGTNTSGSGVFNWGDLIGKGLDTIGDTLSNIFGRNNINQVNYINEQLKREQQTNTILWIVVGLMLVVGAVLVIRKK